MTRAGRLIGVLVPPTLMTSLAFIPTAGAASPPSVSTGIVSSVTPTSATVAGTVDPHGTPTTWFVQYGPSSAAGYSSRTASKSAGAGTGAVSLSAKLSGLSPATSYNYRFVGTNSSGTTYGAVGIVNTSAAPVVITGAASNIGDTSATLNAVINSQGQSTTWYFQYGTTTSFGSTTPHKIIVANANNQAVSATIVGLLPRTTYHFRTIALSSAGTSFGSTLSLTTDLAVSLNASSTPIVYDGSALLSGAVATKATGTQVTVLGEPFNSTAFTTLAVVTTGANGEWTYLTKVPARTTYEVQANGATSSPIVIGVRPAVSLSINRSHQLSASVTAGVTFARHVLQLQRLVGQLWVTWKYVRLNARSQVTFSTSLPKGRTDVRMAIGEFIPGIDQAAPGYLAGYSSVHVYTH